MTTLDNSFQIMEEADACETEFGRDTVILYSSPKIVIPSDFSTDDLMNIVEASGALDFWNEESEDIYDENSGNAL